MVAYRISGYFVNFTTKYFRPFTLSSSGGLRWGWASPMGRDSPKANVTVYAEGLMKFLLFTPTAKDILIHLLEFLKR